MLINYQKRIKKKSQLAARLSSKVHFSAFFFFLIRLFEGKKKLILKKSNATTTNNFIIFLQMIDVTNFLLIFI